MSSGAALRRTSLTGTVGAVAGCLAALLLTPLFASAAAAAPYPPTQPCIVTATQAAHRANVPRPGVVDVDVRGAGLGAGDTVRLTSTDGRTLARVRADTQGGFAAVVTAPARPDGATPAVAAVTALERCVSNPPVTPPGNGANPGSGNPAPTSGGGNGGNPGTPGTTGSTAPSGPLATDIAGSSGAAAPPTSPTATTSGSSGTTSSDTPGSTSVPPRADAPPGTGPSGPSLGIGLAIAAALLVLGTLAVLLLTRRPEH